MEMKFYQCAICGQIVAIVNDTGVPLMCCGESMEEIIPGTADASPEKHVPVIEIHGDQVTVSVGSVPHPMTHGHHIEWIALQTTGGNQRKELRPDTEPKACFCLCKGDEVESVCAWCNLHGLWRTDFRPE